MQWMTCDIETTYLPDINISVVWSVRLQDGESGRIWRFSYLEKFIAFIEHLNSKTLIYVHNLKYDGNYFLNYFFFNKKYQQAFNQSKKEFYKTSRMTPYSYKYLISDKGSWYNITVKTALTTVIFYDSLKLAPLSLDECAKAFHTEHQKLELDYDKVRLPGYVPDESEEDYIDNDVHIMREFLNVLFEEGNTGSTIGACCLKEFKKTQFDFDSEFPDVYQIKINKNEFGSESIGDYILKSYYGAFVYVNPEIKGCIVKNGHTFDVNSLYPFVMHSKSGNKYFYGKPWMVKTPTNEMLKNAGGQKDYFVRFTCGFNLKKGKLPFIHIRRSMLYPASKVLSTSKVYYDGEFYDELDGVPVRPEFTMSREEFEFFKESYELYDLQILDYCFCFLRDKIYDTYIDKYYSRKMTESGGRRTLSKLYLNNLYGKFATRPDSDFKIIYEKEPGIIGFKCIQERKKKPGYILNGSKIISNARLYILKWANKTYRPGTGAGFAYCDTDSLHIIGELNCDLPVDNSKLGYFKDEGFWRRAKFVRAKTYVEDVKQEDGSFKTTVTCAGMTSRNKELLLMSLGEIPCLAKTEAETDFLRKRRTYADFDVGLKIPSKLMPKQVKGGVTLFTTEFTMQRDLLGNIYDKLC